MEDSFRVRSVQYRDGVGVELLGVLGVSAECSCHCVIQHSLSGPQEQILTFYCVSRGGERGSETGGLSYPTPLIHQLSDSFMARAV